jgi:hypothetical protein
VASAAKAAARAGDHDRAEKWAASVADPCTRGCLLAELARSLAESGHEARARYLISAARGLIGQAGGPSRRLRMLAAVAESAARIGDHDQATALAREAESAARDAGSPEDRMAGLARLAKSLLAVGAQDRAAALAGQALILTRQDDFVVPGEATGTLVAVLSALGQQDDAAALAERGMARARSFAIPSQREKFLADIASAAVAGEDFGWAARVAAVISEGSFRTNVLADLAGQAVTARQYGRAEEFAREIMDSFSLGESLTVIADAVAGSDPARAAGLIVSARSVARTISAPHERAYVLGRAARVLPAAGQPEEAAALLGTVEIIAKRLDGPTARAWGLADLAEGLAAVGQRTDAAASAAAAEEAAGAAVGTERVHALNGAALAWAAAGDAGRALSLVRRAEDLETQLSDPQELYRARAAMARAAASAGDFDLALLLGRRVDGVTRNQSFTRLAQIAASAGQHGIAESFVREITSADKQAEEFAALAATALRDRAPARARHLAACALAAGTWTVSLPVLARIDPTIIIALAAAALPTGEPPTTAGPAASQARG